MATRLLLVRLGVHLGGGNATGTRVGWLGSTAFIGVDVRVREHMLKAGGWRALSGVGSCLLVVLAAPGAATPSATAVPVTRVDVTLSDFAIRLTADRVPRGRVIFRVVNRGNLPHGFTVAGRQTGALLRGKPASLSVVLSRPGGYRFASGQPGDAAVGMAGTLRVRVGGKARPLTTSSRLRLTTIATGLGPLTFAVAPPGDPHRLFVVRQDGLVLLFKDGVKEDRPFLDLCNRIDTEGEQALLSIAFAPDYATSGRFYAYFTNRDGNIRIVERQRSEADPDVADSSGRRVLAVVKHTANHNGGMMQFGPDGYLYASIGDGGADPPTVPVGRYGQTLGDVFGTIIRIDPRADAPYGIPPDNPFVSVEGARPEIVAYGLRNPWRFAIDAKTKTMLIADVGEGAREEVDRLPLDRLGLNFGWPCKEGSIVPPKVDIPESCTGARLTPPLFEYPHGEKRCSITGGVVARAPDLRALDGLYLWADFCEGRVNALTAAGNVVPLNLRAEQPTSFGLDGTGRIYVTTATGTLLRLDIGDRA